MARLNEENQEFLESYHQEAQLLGGVRACGGVCCLLPEAWPRPVTCGMCPHTHLPRSCLFHSPFPPA